MTGKVVLITGATDGIGRQAARELAALGARVAVVGRNPQKLADTLSELGAGAVGIRADLSVQAEVRRAAAEFKARFDRLDVLINNAGNGFFLRRLSADGIEMTWALNHMAYFILTLELLDVMKASAPSRVVNTSSSAHYKGCIRWKDVERTWGYWMLGAYEQSKLANVMFTYALARRLEGTGVTANALHPGFVRTNIGGTQNGWLGRLGQRIIFYKGISVEEGARATMRLATDPALEGMTAKFFTRFGERRSSESSHDVNAQERLWALSEGYVRKAVIRNQ
ncbi:MAG: SDR family oxidoreductase [Anaerolineae bacterium]|nr:MAG: SDR family oxidoreductase [Anaerolineae bacterium]